MGIEKIPLIGGLFDNSDKKAQEQYEKILRDYEAMQTPNVAWQEYSPEELAYLGDYNPEMAAYEQIKEDPRLLGQQEQYLKQLKSLSEQGMSAEDAAVFDQAQRQSAQQARGAREATMSNMAARGMAGSGMELLSKELANQQAAERSRASMMDQAGASARQKALYTQAYGGELGSQRQANMQAEAKNKDIINRFNEMNTGARNTAMAQNLANRQQMATANSQLRNASQQYNQQGRRDATQQGFQNQMARLGGISGARQGQAQSYLAQSEANRAARGAGGALLGGALGLGGVFGEDKTKGTQLGAGLGSLFGGF